ncbi:T9SS type B sorting domain-containing protein [Xanthomarina sp. F2636L]|uniref:T9SS type B sorting domain-containing protein n=1 Tax=Xanthomarina sp. F2636L TaxID=2996018 RepID=UPI00225E4616|nr:choice-of-anchor L domain-containing protein [Xanthomarina sp. F2636L]MCX7549961.1 choice-of-anchor L domain-containing protein [Xanthomarina sp. F2636L]
MKPFLLITFLLVSCVMFSQNLTTDSRTYTAQELIEDILIDSNCITDVVVTNAVSGNFNGADSSYGYFDGNGSTFPFQNGVVLSTGRLENVQGPNTTLSDDNADDWFGDADLEYDLNESNTTNATILEFNFRAIADQISFRYLFASEEYQQGDSNTCRYSDLFGFLIRKEDETRYENIAVIPGTMTPVKVTTVHSGIPGACDPINEAYFGGWNDSSAPINFNGQTEVLTAIANVIPNEVYHVKLVIADHINYRYDSAVFLEAGSFQLNTNLGPDLLIANNTALCTDETILLDASQPGTNTYKWFRNGIELLLETDPTYLVTEAGTYNVEVIIDGTCLSYGKVTIEVSPNPIVFNTNLISCDYNLDGYTTYNLYDAEADVTNNDSRFSLENFYLSEADALSNTDPIPTPTSFENTILNQIVYARVSNANGCISVAEVTLTFADNPVILPLYPACDDETDDGITTFNLTDMETFVLAQSSVPNSSVITFYASQVDLENQMNPLSGTYENTDSSYFDTLYVQITDNGVCYAYNSIYLIVYPSPILAPDEEFTYCLNLYPQTITLEAGILSGVPSDFNYQWLLDGVDLMQNSEEILINETGVYTVNVTNSDNCTTSRIITVLPSNVATLEDIVVTEASSNNSITINVSGEGDYEYALDNGYFQDSNTFTNVAAGYHIGYIQDKNSCGIISVDVSVLGFPKFFTPNGDGYNDFWKPIGIDYFETSVETKIFNRYGKLMKELNAFGTGWNGTFNGNLLPSDDYWFVVSFSDGKVYRGHFSLKR